MQSKRGIGISGRSIEHLIIRRLSGGEDSALGRLKRLKPLHMELNS